MNIIDMLDNWLQDQENKKAKEPRKLALYPSSASFVGDLGDGEKLHGTCMRQEWYRLKGIEETPKELRNLYQIHFGNLTHDFISSSLTHQFLKNSGKEIQVEKSLEVQLPELTLPIRCRMDIIVPEQAVIEVKSTYGQSARKIKTGPKSDNLPQCMFYSKYNKLPVILLYIMRDTGYRKQFIIDCQEELRIDGVKYPNITFDNVLDRWKTLLDYYNSDTLPPRDYFADPKSTRDDKLKTDDWQCLWCGRKSLCDAGI